MLNEKKDNINWVGYALKTVAANFKATINIVSILFPAL